MKKIFLLLFLLVSMASGADVNDWERDRLKGKVKEFIEKNFTVEYRQSKMEKVLLRKIVKKYDEEGNRIEEQEYRYGEFFNKYNRKFNAAGNRIMNIINKPERNIITNTNYRYDGRENSNKNIKDISFYSKDSYQYDQKGNMIEWKNFRSDGSLFSKYSYAYDTNSNMTENIFYDVDGIDKWKNTFKYDQKGNMTRKEVYKYGVLYSRYIFKYDIQNNMIEETQYVMPAEPDKNELKLNWINTYEYKYW